MPGLMIGESPVVKEHYTSGAHFNRDIGELLRVKYAFSTVKRNQQLSAEIYKKLILGVIYQYINAIYALHAAEASGFNHTQIFAKLSEEVLRLRDKYNRAFEELLPSLHESVLDLDDGLDLNEGIYPNQANSYRHRHFEKDKMIEIIATHVYRQGLIDVGDALLSEAGLPRDQFSAVRSQFKEMLKLTKAVKARNMKLPLKWIDDNMNQLGKAGTELKFKLHSLKFISILKRLTISGREEGFDYATHFREFDDAQSVNEIGKLMACRAFAFSKDRVRELSGFPYPYLFSPSYEKNVIEELERQFCILNQHGSRSPLGVVISAGAKVLPAFSEVAVELKSSGIIFWEIIQDFPMKVDLPEEFRFHSVFVDPKFGVVASPLITPMALPCGHVISLQNLLHFSEFWNSGIWCRNKTCAPFPTVEECKPVYF